MKFFKKIKNGFKKYFLVLREFFAKLPFFKFGKKNGKKIYGNFKDFLDEEKEEIEELASGKEGLKRFCCDSGSIFKEYFIPTEENGHRPKILRAKSLVIIAAVLVIVKMSVTGYLFFIYPNQAKMSELITKNILELINVDRKSNGISELTNNSVLNEAALSKAKDMVEKGYFAHKSPDGRMSWDFINRSEYAYLFVGENLAMNFTSAQSAHKALMLSETHKKNILSGKYSDVGLAILTGVIDGRKTNVLVQIFGSANNTKLAMVSAADDQTVKSESPAESEIIENPTVEKIVAVKQEISAENPQIEVKEASAVKEEIKKTEEGKKIEETKEIGETKKTEAIKDIEKTEKPAVQTPAEKIIAKVRAASALSVKPKVDNIDFSGMNASLAGKVKSFNIEAEKEITMAESIIKMSRYTFFIALVIIAVSLLINIFIKFRIQHKPLIIESILAMIFIISLIYIKTNFLEYVLEKVFVV
ncbi:hypothetical protein KAI52_02500 [Candidatus Parcubacteria bacterium]|nr:hypothetical protein [Candidatus Parcubacteria bacterium]